MKIKPILYFLTFTLLVVSCDDSSTGSTKAENVYISGTITFTNIENWPALGEVTVSLSKTWPPTGMPSDYSLITSSDLNSDNQYNYEFNTSDVGSTFRAIAVAWENPDTTYNSTCNKSILGAYGGSITNYFMVVDSLVATTDLDSINFDANFSYAIPNSYSLCQPSCMTEPNQFSCESHGHCLWDDSSGCTTKQ